MTVTEDPTTTSPAVTSTVDPDARSIELARVGDPDLGQLAELPGTWRNGKQLAKRGWNLIALPFATDPDPATGRALNYRVLMNRYNEVLKFSLVDKNVPNRGISFNGVVAQQADQEVGALDYEQSIKQVAAEDFPSSGVAGSPDAAIHHEPGLFLFMQDQPGGESTIGRLATVPHGDAVLALGTATTEPGPPRIPTVNALPIGVPQDIDSPYLAPYKHFVDNKFDGLFDPTDISGLLEAANAGVNIVETTTITLDSTVESGGIRNIPFIVKQANATEMRSTFWIQKIIDGQANISWRLQYLQVVMLDFFPRRDGGPGLIKWPHISFNTMEKDTNTTDSEYGAIEFGMDSVTDD